MPRPVLKRKIICMPNKKTYIATELASARQQINNTMYDVIINIGLILKTLGTRDEEVWSYNLEHDELTVSENDNEYLVFKTTKNNVSRTKIFHVRVGDHGLNLTTFQRGRWEKTLDVTAENIRIANKAWEITNGAKEVKE